MNTITLDGTWYLRALDKDIIRSCCPRLDGTELEFTLPNDIHSVLLDHGLIDDPFTGQNALKSSFITKTGWQMRKSFSFSRTQGQRTVLSLSGLDCIASVSLNGNTVGQADNAFRRWLMDVTNELRDGENELVITFSALDEEIDRLKRERKNLRPASLVRKSARHFGPYSITPEGIYEPVRLISDEVLFVKSWNCIPRLVSHNWIMKVEITADVFCEADVSFSVSVAMRTEQTVTHVRRGQENYSFTFTIPEEDVARWEPAGMGGQHLYPLDITFASYSDKRMIAFRTVSLVSEEDSAGRSFTLLVNDRPVFIKGMIWTGLDILPSRLNPTRCIRALQSAQRCGINAIRVHCSSAYESELFYDSCDRLGLLVWQDFMFDEAEYSLSEAFMKNVEEEVRYQTLRLMSHPCLAIFCAGGSPAIADLDAKQAVSYDRLNYAVIERTVKSLSPDAVYVPHSLAESPDTTVRTHNSPSWGLSSCLDEESLAVISSEEGPVPRFVCAVSFPSFPSLSTISGYCEEKEINIAADSMMKHQSRTGVFELIVSSILEHYRFPDSLEKMVYLSQVSQADIISRIMDNLRSRSPLCSGVFIKSLTSNFPAADESAVEYSGKWKMLMYQLRNIFAPITTICIRQDRKIRVMAQNDTGQETEVKVSVKFSSFHGDKLKMQVFRKVLPPHSLTAVSSTDYSFIKDTSEAFAYVKLSTPDIYREDLVLLEEPKRCHFRDPELKVDVARNGRNFLCTVSCTCPAFLVCLDAGSLKGFFSENLFSIRPTAQKLVTFFSEEDISIEEFKASLTTFDLYKAGT